MGRLLCPLVGAFSLWELESRRTEPRVVGKEVAIPKWVSENDGKEALLILSPWFPDPGIKKLLKYTIKWLWI